MNTNQDTDSITFTTHGSAGKAGPNTKLVVSRVNTRDVAAIITSPTPSATAYFPIPVHFSSSDPRILSYLELLIQTSEEVQNFYLGLYAGPRKCWGRQVNINASGNWTQHGEEIVGSTANPTTGPLCLELTADLPAGEYDFIWIASVSVSYKAV